LICYYKCSNISSLNCCCDNKVKWRTLHRSIYTSNKNVSSWYIKLKKKKESVKMYSKKRRKILLRCPFNNTTHHYPIVIMVKSSNHMFAYSFFFSLYQLLDIFHRRLPLLLQRWMAVVRSTLCLDVHQPQSFINDEKRRKRISFFFFLKWGRREKGRWRANTSILFSTFLMLCTTICQPLLNSGRKPHTNGRFLSSVLFRPHLAVAYFQVLTL
jgi:hypothetical protein